METEGKDLGCVGCTCVSFQESHQGIGTNLVKVGTRYLKDSGLSTASLSYTYTGLDKMHRKVIPLIVLPIFSLLSFILSKDIFISKQLHFFHEWIYPRFSKNVDALSFTSLLKFS